MVVMVAINFIAHNVSIYMITQSYLQKYSPLSRIWLIGGKLYT